MPPFKLKKLTLKGFKSFDGDGQSVSFGDITILLGANGSGKSNFISFFKLLNYLVSGGLQIFVGEQGFADSLLHYGASTTSRIQAKLSFGQLGAHEDTYDFTLSHASGDTLIFTEERLSWTRAGWNRPQTIDLGAGQKETNLLADALQESPTQRTIRFVLNLLRSCRVYQFHDTSRTAKIRNQGYVNDNEYLRDNAGNLAAFLYVMANKQEWKNYYVRIVAHIQSIMPQFADFILKPSPLNERYIELDWHERGRDYRFGPHQISDGTLRFMALAALLLQPPATLPGVIVLDEPELGLHPEAISSLAGMIRMASLNSQVILATQAPRLVDEFRVDEIVIVERDEADGKNRSLLKRLDEQQLSEWLKKYTLSELWEKNVTGGKP